MPRCGNSGARYAKRLAVALALVVPPLHAQDFCAGETARLCGTWRGSAHQIPAGDGGADYAVVMQITATGGSIDYPTLSCGGTLARIATGPVTAEFRESITYGPCVTGGTVMVNYSQGKLAWNWNGSERGRQYIAIGVLQK